MNKTVVGMAVAVVALAAWTACVGDDGTTTPASQGALGEACFANNTCLAPLACENKVCVAVDDGGTSSSSSSSSSGNASKNPPQADCGDLSDGNAPTCPKGTDDIDCHEGETCCPGLGCAAACDHAFGCFADAHCSGAGQKCCFQASKVAAPSGVSCVDQILEWDTSDEHGSACRNSCAETEFELCSFSGADPCTPPAHCTQIGILLDGAPGGGQYVKTVGACL